MRYRTRNGIYDKRILQLGRPDRFQPHGPPNLLPAQHGLDADRIRDRVGQFLKESS